MAISRAKKTEKVTMLTKELASSTSAIVGTFAGLTAAKDFELRKAIRAAGGSYHVVKNKLAAKASEGSKIEAALQGLKGVSAVAYTSGDPVQLAKALSTWVKDNSEFTFKLGIVDGKVISVKEIGDLATMPGKEELFSKLLFLIQSPAQRLATVINATGRDLAVVINQAVEKEKFSGAAPAASSVSAPTASAPATETSAESAGHEPVMHEPMTETEKSPMDAVVDPQAPKAPEPEIAAAHKEEAPTPAEASAAATETIAEHPASEADPVAETTQPENSTASQGGAAANSEPAEG